MPVEHTPFDDDDDDAFLCIESDVLDKFFLNGLPKKGQAVEMVCIEKDGNKLLFKLRVKK